MNYFVETPNRKWHYTSLEAALRHFLELVDVNDEPDVTLRYSHD